MAARKAEQRELCSAAHSSRNTLPLPRATPRCSLGQRAVRPPPALRLPTCRHAHPACSLPLLQRAPSQASNLGRRKLGDAKAAADAALRGSECIGADTLLQLLKNYARRWAGWGRGGCPGGAGGAGGASAGEARTLRRRHAAVADSASSRAAPRLPPTGNAPPSASCPQRRHQDGHHGGRGGPAQRRQVERDQLAEAHARGAGAACTLWSCGGRAGQAPGRAAAAGCWPAAWLLGGRRGVARRRRLRGPATLSRPRRPAPRRWATPRA